MNIEIIDQTADVVKRAAWRSDAEVGACFAGLYRRLRLQSVGGEPLRAVGVTSHRSGEGVSTVAARLAVAAAEQGAQKVLLLDANHRAPAIQRNLALGQTPGFFRGNADSRWFEEAFEPTVLSNLWILPAGCVLSAPIASQCSVDRAAANSAQNGAHRNIGEELLRELALEFSFIVVDMPHVDAIGACAGWVNAVHGLLLVVDGASITRTHLQANCNALSRFRLLGAVLNKRP